MSLSTRPHVVKNVIRELAPEYTHVEVNRSLEYYLPKFIFKTIAKTGAVQSKRHLLEELAKFEDENEVAKAVKALNEQKEIPEGNFKAIFRVLNKCLDENETIESVKKSIEDTILKNKAIHESLKKPMSHMITFMSIQAEFAELKLKNDRLTSKAVEFQNLATASGKTAKEARNLATKLEGDLEKEKSERAPIEREVKSLNEKNSKLSLDIFQLNDRNKQQQKSIDDLKETNKSLEDKIAKIEQDNKIKLEQALKDAKKAWDEKYGAAPNAKTQQIAQLVTQVDDLTKKILNLNQKNDAIIKDSTNNELRAMSLEEECKKNSSEINRLTRIIDEKNRLINSTRKTNTELTNQLTALQNDHKQLKDEHAAFTEEQTSQLRLFDRGAQQQSRGKRAKHSPGPRPY